MPRRRMIDPNIWESEDFGALTLTAKMVFVGLFSLADDDGRGRSKPAYVKSKLFPYDDTITNSDVAEALAEIKEHMSIVFYEVDGSKYYSLKNWSKWQRIDKPQASKIPAPSDVLEDEESFCDEYENDSGTDKRIILELVQNDSRIDLRPKEIEDKEKDKEKKNIIPPLPPKGDEAGPRLGKDAYPLELVEDEKPTRRRKPSTLTKKQGERFNRFWAIYPRKVSIGDAEKAWAKIDPDDDLAERIIDAVEDAKRFDSRFRELRYTPHPATWLNGKEWMNVYNGPEERAKPPTESRFANLERIYREFEEEERNGGSP